jgi:DNA-binding Xre family transcriptional regulator
MSLQKLADEIEVLKAEYEKFERGNKSAGTRSRKILQNIKKICQEIRIQIQDAKQKEEV